MHDSPLKSINCGYLLHLKLQVHEQVCGGRSLLLFLGEGESLGWVVLVRSLISGCKVEVFKC
jgi:hypothetical protein